MTWRRSSVRKRKLLIACAVVALFGAEAWGAAIPEAVDEAPTPVEVAP